MAEIINKIKLLFAACRGYSAPTSILSWLIPFVFCALNGGNILYGILVFPGILALHMGVNIFDDCIDYIKELNDINSGKKHSFNFQKGKCEYIMNGSLSLKSSFIIAFALFFIAILTGQFFINIYGLKLIMIIIITAILCLFYPILGCFCLGEIIVGTIYSVLLYSGISIVMTGNINSQLLIISVSTGMLVVNVLYNHMLLDYKVDTTNRKITLCRLCGNENNALILQILIISLAYINILIQCAMNNLPYLYLTVFITLPYAIVLIKNMKLHIKNPNAQTEKSFFNIPEFIINKIPDNQKSFIIKFLMAENLLYTFAIVLCILIITDRII